MCALLLAGCGKQDITPTTPSTAAVPSESVAPVTEAPIPETVPVTEVPTEPEDPSLTIENLPVEDVLLYFNEVVLDAEYFSTGDPSLVQKWTVPICYILYGTPTEEDRNTLNRFADWLNTLEGFPGISQTTDPTTANLRIHFCDQETMLDLMGNNFYGCDGGVTFWYEENVIYDAIICIRTDIGQTLRNSVILEEIYNGLGPVQDTDLRPDSLIYSGYSEPQELTAMDQLILKLLYHPDLSCGMNAAECEAMIRQLYY
jgi:hypothetical protein